MRRNKDYSGWGRICKYECSRGRSCQHRIWRGWKWLFRRKQWCSRCRLRWCGHHRVRPRMRRGHLRAGGCLMHELPGRHLQDNVRRDCRGRLHAMGTGQVRDRSRPDHGHVHRLPRRHLTRDDRGGGAGGLQDMPGEDVLWIHLVRLHALRRRHVLADRGRGRVLRG